MLAVITAIALLPTGAAQAQFVTAGADYFATPPNGDTYLNFGTAPLPADFFGPGSDPFEGQISLGGTPIDPSLYGDSSTIIQRMADAAWPGPSTIPIEMTGLSLISVQPIEVTFSAPPAIAVYEVSVVLNTGGPPSSGVMTIHGDLESEGGGWYDGIELNVYPMITFSLINGPISAQPIVELTPLDPFIITSELGEEYDWQPYPPVAPPDLFPIEGPDFFPIDPMPLPLVGGGIVGGHGVTPVREIDGCCFPDGTCMNLEPAYCLWQGGTPQGVLCTGMTEACCLPDGSCLMTDPLCCDDIGGQVVAGQVCAGSIEACCDGFPPAGCMNADAMCCTQALGGEAKGAGSACQGDVNPPNGLDDACEEPEPFCEMPPGQDWCAQLQATDCLKDQDDQLCLPVEVFIEPTGGFRVEFCDCLIPGGCGGIYIEGGDTFVCPGDCPPGEICQVFTNGIPTGRTDMGLAEIPVGTIVTCGCADPPLTEACCFPDGSCADLTQLDCVNMGGNPQGVGSVCSGFTMACCLPQGACEDVDPLCCDDIGGTLSPTGAGMCLGDHDVPPNGIDDACEIPCEPLPDGSGCVDATCPDVTEICQPHCAVFDPTTGQADVTECECRADDECHLVLPPPPSDDPCVVEDNGTGTVTLPPIGCEYLSPGEVHQIIDGLPPGTTIELDPIHRNFFCDPQVGLCSGSIPPGVCEIPGGSLGGHLDCFHSELEMELVGTGDLTGFVRTITLPVDCEVHTGPRQPGEPVQTFANDMFRLQGQLLGDPDFDTLAVTGGSDFGLPSPGETTLTRLPTGNFAVDSFFDITYQIDFAGAPGSVLDGMSGTTTATIRMRTPQSDAPTCEGDCPNGEICEESIADVGGGLIEYCCDCVPVDVDGCCLEDGTCINVPADQCEGIVQATLCSGTLEACCMPEGICRDLDPICCDDIGGTPGGPGSACEFITVACCFDGICRDVDPACCEVLGGELSPTGDAACIGDLSGNGIDDSCEYLDIVVCEPQGGPNPTHPPAYWYEVTPEGFGRCDFHVRVFDEDPGNYTSWNIFPWPGDSWRFMVHNVGGEWWASWWDSTASCDAAFFVPTVFEFTHMGESTWGEWRTTIGNSPDPTVDVVDTSDNHPAAMDGFGRRVHVPTPLGADVRRPDIVEWVAADGSVGGSCTADADCCGNPCEGYCIPQEDGSFPGSCYGPQHRYLSVDNTVNNPTSTAMRVTLLSGVAGPWWVGPPAVGGGGLMLASLQATPHYSTAWPVEVHITDCEVASNNTYLVQAIAAGADIGDPGNYSATLEVRTPTVWGDTVSTCFSNVCYPADGSGGIDDILAAIAKFQGVNNAPLTWLDIDPSTGSAIPNQQVNIGDILGTLDGFQGKPYPGNGPGGC